MNVDTFAVVTPVHLRTYANTRTRSLIAWLAASTLVIYLISSPLFLLKNFVFGDLWSAFAMFLVLFSRKALKSLIRFFRSGYFFWSYLISTATLVATFNAPDTLSNFKFIAQFWTTLWILTPLVAVGFSEMNSPMTFLEICGWVYLTIYAMGSVLLFSFGINWIIGDTGIGRFWPQSINFGAFPLTTLCLSVTYLCTTKKLKLRYLVMLLSVAAIEILKASRTGYVVIIVVIIIASASALRSWRGFLSLLIAGGATGMLLFSTFLNDMLGIRLVTTHFFEDDIRLNSINTAWQTIRQDGTALLLGVGWGNSGAGGQVVHNVPFQTLTEAGILTALGLLGLLALPLMWIVRSKYSNSVERTFAFLLYGGLWVMWMFEPIPAERTNWLPFVVLMGMANRLRVDHRRNSPSNLQCSN